MMWWETFTQGFRAWAETVGLIKKKLELNNTPEMQDAAKRQKEKDAEAEDARIATEGTDEENSTRLS